LHGPSFPFLFVGFPLKVWPSASRAAFGAAGRACSNRFNLLPKLLSFARFRFKPKDLLGIIKSDGLTENQISGGASPLSMIWNFETAKTEG
jgi:hypothetical protein